MPVVIRMPNTTEDTYALIELQGDLKSQTETPFDGKFIGDLHFTKGGMPILIVGHHLMYGKEAKLDKPLALIKRGVQENATTEYTVGPVITKKILFRTRPKPIVDIPKAKGSQNNR